MRIGPRYKIARRLGPDIFEKTQSQKFALSLAKRGKEKKRSFTKSEFGMQLREKQRARFFYGMNERQFSRLVKEAIAKKTVKDDEYLYLMLENRLDNVVYRSGLAPSKQAARQFVSHGHFCVNGARVMSPSYHVKTKDVVTLRTWSAKKPLFSNLAEKIANRKSPPWLRLDIEKRQIEILGLPKLTRSELPFNIGSILEFYRR